MAGSLEFIKSVSGTSITSLDVTDCFSDTYEVYYVKISLDTDNLGYFEMMLLDSGGSLITGSDYDIAVLEMKSNTTFGEYRFTNQNESIGWRNLGVYIDDGDGYGFSAYIYNPFDSSSYTFATAQSASSVGSNMFGGKAIGVHKQTTSASGFRIKDSSVSTFNYINCSVYGVK